ncbi:hypothetical protein ACE4RU_10805 [Actinobacillus seminis]|uniref:hypothetical protein n=1 Tax=Actinobacillus seminis TaxID=722 RepID=UPI003B924E59
MSQFKKAIEERVKLLKDAKNKAVRVGIIDKQYDDGTSVAYVGAIHEYGASGKNIPPRPFIRPTVADKKTTWAKTGKAVLAKGGAIEDMFEAIGLQASAHIRETIANIDNPKLADATIAARKRKYKSKKSKATKDPEKPLVDSGYLLNSISYEVIDKE